MRTTITLDDDVSAAVSRLKTRRGMGISAVVNELVRRGLMQTSAPATFQQRTSDMGARLDVSNIADTLELLDGPAAR